MLGLGIAFAVASGTGFAHWAPGRSGRVLYVDGEMPAATLRARIVAESERSGAAPNLDVLSTEHFDLGDLNRGTDQLDSFLSSRERYDLIVLDNLAALTSGELKEEAAIQALESWMKRLSRSGTAQIWLHHTGHNESRSYGSNRALWGMDVALLIKPIRSSSGEITFELRFTKSRGRTPENRDDFNDVVVALGPGERGTQVWTVAPVAEASNASQGKAKRLTSGAKVALDALPEAIRADGEPLGPEHDLARGVTKDVWQRHAAAAGIAPNGSSRDAIRMAMGRAVKALSDSGLVRETNSLWHEADL